MNLSNIVSMSYNISHNTIFWEPPYTLNITEVEPDILSYTVCTLIDYLPPEECWNVSSGSVTMAKYSVGVRVSIAANNIVGRSNEVTHLVNPCSNMLSGAYWHP